AAAGGAGVPSAQEEARRELTIESIHAGPLEGTPISGAAWAPDGRRLVWLKASTPGGKQLIHLFDGATSRISTLTTEAEGPAGLDVASFAWAPLGDVLAVAAGGDLYLVAAGGVEQPPRRLTRTEIEEKDPKVSPDGLRVGFVRDGDLYTIDLTSGAERRLTRGIAREVLNGAPDWVYEEEFGLASAWWWAPASTRVGDLQFDQREVPRYPLVDLLPVHPIVTWQHYPKAGDRNALVRAGVVPVEGPPRSGEDSVPPTRWMNLGDDPDTYLPRAGWTPQGRLAVQRLDREQSRLELLSCDAATGECRRLLEETDPHWINIGDDLEFLSDGRFIRGSERDGRRHLYLHGPQGDLERRLTGGSWDVRELARTDEKAGVVWYSSTEDGPNERHLYRVGLDGGQRTRLTRERGWHDTTVGAGGMHLDQHSSVETPPGWVVRTADGRALATLEAGTAREVARYDLGRVEFVDVPAADGTPLPSRLIYPPGFDPARRYPVLIYVYGGPHAQVVRDRWDGANWLWHRMMAGLGYVVFSLDNRGMGARGHAWETPIDRRMCRQELADQLDGVAWLRRQGWVDGSRIGLWGWSYGGYMTLYALLKAPEGTFRMGVSVAPVTDWRNYDTIYTERYMDRPADNPDGYLESAPLHEAHRLGAPLLLVHGTADDNVHMQNSAQLLDALVTAGRPVEFMLYNGKGHAIAGRDARVHLFNRITRFIKENL
ncbi:MAG TPA: S9 family peptidase, partial [Candidatus Polarisedimenticolia bacterium]|nr:S9 family peptidase [Candidatus Polarisedimenticolia bacterium]